MTELEGLLERLVAALDGAGVPFMIAGSFASAAHGLPPSGSRTVWSAPTSTRISSAFIGIVLRP